MKNTENEVWYNNADWIVNLILIVIVSIILCSQSFAVGRDLSFTLFSSVINHNSIYFFNLIYFVLLKFSFGKKYFNYMNVILMFLYFLTSVTTFFTVIQAFSLNAVLSFLLNFFFLIYLFHTFLRGTRAWKEFKLFNSPFNELTNEWIFYGIVVVSVFVLAVDLISTVVFSGVILSVLDAFFAILFGRYIFLYRQYLDSHNIDNSNDGNFDGVKEDINQFVNEVGDKVQDTFEQVDLSGTVEKIKENIEETAKEVTECFSDEKHDDNENDKKEQEEQASNHQKENKENKSDKKSNHRRSNTNKKDNHKKKGEE